MLLDKTFNIAKNPNYDGYQRSLASMVYKFFDKKSASNADKFAKDVGVDTFENKKIAEELHKLIIRKFEKIKVHLSFIDNSWVADLADMQLISNLIQEFVFYNVLSIFLVNMYGLFSWKIKMELQLLILFKKCYMNLSIYS